MASFGEFFRRNAESAAYHEAGHVVAAAVQGLPFQTGGMHIDLEGSGVAYYCHREPGDIGRSRTDQVEREKTIIALFAAWYAQARFFPDCAHEESWSSDRRTADILLAEMKQVAPGLSKSTIENRAFKLVTERWQAIEDLAETLLGKPESQMSDEEFKRGWSLGRKRREKHLTLAEITSSLRKHGITIQLAAAG